MKYVIQPCGVRRFKNKLAELSQSEKNLWAGYKKDKVANADLKVRALKCRTEAKAMRLAYQLLLTVEPVS